MFCFLVNHGFLEEAASLAEKYLEFNALVRICEKSNDNVRLEKYMDQFADQVKISPLHKRSYLV